jgi:MFS family permease
VAFQALRHGAPGGRGSFWWLIAVLAAAELACTLEAGMMAVALASAYRSSGDVVHAGWLITAFELGAAASAAVCGRLGDLFGRKRLMLIMLGSAVLGSTLSALGRDFNLIIAGRALQGASMAVLPLCIGIVREVAPARDVSLGVSVLGGVYGIGAGAGMLLSGLICDVGPWQNIFIVNGASALLALLLVAAFIPAAPGRRPSGPLDLLGGMLFAPAVAALLLSLTLARRESFPTPGALALLVFGLATLGFWVRHELVTPNPLINVRLLANRQIAATNACIFLFAAGPANFINVLLPMMQQPTWTGAGLGASATSSALVKLPSNFTGGLAAITAGFAGRKVGLRAVVLGACLVVFATWTLLAVKHDSLLIIGVVTAALQGPAMIVLNANAPALVLDAAPEARSSEAVGVSQVIRMIGRAIGFQVITLVLATSTIGDDTIGGVFPDDAAYTLSFAYMAVLGLMAAAAAGLIPHRLPAIKPTARAHDLQSTPNR